MKAIQATPESLRSIFSKYEFVIPEFQRPYSWEKEHCGQLWDDISHFCQNAEQQDQYFLGSIVVYPTPNTKGTWNIVDGQQRLTTLMILIKVLFDYAGTMKILQRFLYRADPQTDELCLKSLRLKSLVEAGAGRDDANDLKVTILEEGKFANPKNKFKANYDYLKEQVADLWRGKSPEERVQFIEFFCDNVVLLPIECNSVDDALDLFQIINDRGMQLSDADIFKAKIYSAIKSDNDKNSFIERWGEINSHSFLFRLFMHISRAERQNTNKEINIRKYVLEHHLKDRIALASEWNLIIRSLEVCYWAWTTQPLCSEKINVAKEKIYWKILNGYTNDYWRHPVFVFLHKYVQGNDSDEFCLPENRHAEYLTLLRDTIRYFFIRGVVYNNVNRVRDTTYKVCAAIAEGSDYKNLYSENILENKRNDIEAFNQRLENCEYGRYRTGLILINSIPDNENNCVKYSDALEKTIHIEHILPRKWNDYDKWNKESHARDIDKLGNLIPLERKINIAASNEFFPRKQEKYKESAIRDALDLSEKDPHWYPEDVEKRHTEVNARLMAFFREPFGT